MSRILLCTLLLLGAIVTFGSCDVDIPEVEKPVYPEKEPSFPDDEANILERLTSSPP